MSSEDKFWAIFWLLSATTACVLTVTIGMAVMHRNVLLADVIATGADPIEARCAFVSSTNATMCALAAASRDPKVKDE